MMSLFNKITRLHSVVAAAQGRYSARRQRAVRMEDEQAGEEAGERDSANAGGAGQSGAPIQARDDGKTEGKGTLESEAGNTKPGSESPAGESKRRCGERWVPSSVKRFFSYDSWFSPEPSHQLDYSQMSLTEKRRHYTCGEDYKTLEDVPTWDEFHRTLRYPKDLEESQLSVDEDLNKKVSLWRGDITHLEIDAIVNAANHSLLGGGGVDGAIHRAASRALLRECEGLGGCHTGDTKLTGGHRLPAKFVLHTVGPMDGNRAMLESCYRRCLELVLKHNIRSVAFPCIATGIYGYPHNEAAELALRVTREWLQENRDKVERIIFCVFQNVDYKFYCRYLHSFYPVEKPAKSQSHDTGPEGVAELGPDDGGAPFKPSMAYSVSAPGGSGRQTREHPEKAAPPEKPAEPLPPTVQPAPAVSSETPATPPPDATQGGTETVTETEKMEVESDQCGTLEQLKKDAPPETVTPAEPRPPTVQPAPALSSETVATPPPDAPQSGSETVTETEKMEVGTHSDADGQGDKETRKQGGQEGEQTAADSVPVPEADKEYTAAGDKSQPA